MSLSYLFYYIFFPCFPSSQYIGPMADILLALDKNYMPVKNVKKSKK